MNGTHQIEPTSTEQLLASLNLAIYEAELVRSFVQSKDIAKKLEADKSISRRMIVLNREIELLKTKQVQVRHLASRD